MSDELRIAYHEAGHAVMHVITEFPFDLVTIVPTDDYYGYVKQNPGPTVQLYCNLGSGSRKIGALARDAIKILFAGGLAEAVFTGRYDEEICDCDLDEIWNIAWHRSRNPEKYMRNLKSETKALVRNRKHWGMISRLAEGLHERKTMTDREVYAALETEYPY